MRYAEEVGDNTDLKLKSGTPPGAYCGHLFVTLTTAKMWTMGTIELKSNLHKILDKIENEQLLRAVYDFLKENERAEEGQIWRTLTEEQKKEVYLSYEESQDDNKLIDWETVKKKY